MGRTGRGRGCVSIKRWNARRDASERVLCQYAIAHGWRLWKLDEPVDRLALFYGRWFPVEIKEADGKMTRRQDEFLEIARLLNAEVLIWRTESDIEADTKRLRGW